MMANQAKDATEYLYSGNQKRLGTFLSSIETELFFWVSVTSIYSFGILLLRYEMQDLHVTETLPQMVALSETYMQIYEQHEWVMDSDHHIASLFA